MSATGGMEQPISLNQESALALGLLQDRFNKILIELAQESTNNTKTSTPERLKFFESRLDLGLWYFRSNLKKLYHWLFDSQEVSNFTYQISDSNKDYLAAFCSAITNIPLDKSYQYINELVADQALRSHVSAELPTLASRGMPLDPNFDFGRRIGWYVFARATKPNLIIETGVAQGLGSLVLTSALIRNKSEGFGGYYLGTDIDPSAGYLFKGPYTDHGKILYGDSITSLEEVQGKIDLFINDSDHSAEYELREYQTVAAKLSEKAMILGDNSHSSSSLCDFAKQSGRRFLFFQERPKDHWYPGAGIGVAY